MSAIIYAADFGVDSANSAATNNTNLQNAINAAYGSILQLPSGAINVSATFNITSAIILRGCGMASLSNLSSGSASSNLGTMIVMSDPGANVFHCETWDSVQFSDFTIKMPSNGTHNGIFCVSPDISIIFASYGARISNMHTIGGGNGIAMVSCANFVIRDCHIYNPTVNGIYIATKQNEVNQDLGDASIYGCNIQDFSPPNTASGAGIKIDPASGISISKNKILGFKNSIWTTSFGVAGTQLMSLNSLENFSQNAFRLDEGAAGSMYGHIVFTGNQILNGNENSEAAIAIVPGAARYGLFIDISHNIVRIGATVAAPYGIAIADGDHVIVSHNIIDMGSTAGGIGISTGGNASNVSLIDNKFCNVPTRYSAMVPTLVVDHVGIPLSAYQANFMDGSEIYITNGRSRNYAAGDFEITDGGAGAMSWKNGGHVYCLRP